MPDQNTLQESPGGDDPLAELQMRFEASIDRVQMMIDSVAEVLAPLDTLPELGLPADESDSGSLESTLRQIAGPGVTDDEEASAAGNLTSAGEIARGAAAELPDIGQRTPSLPETEGGPGRRAGRPVSSSRGPSGVLAFLRQEVDRHFNSPLMRFSQQQDPAGSSPLEQIAHAIATGGPDPNASETDAVRSGRRGAVSTGSASRDDTRTGASAADDSPANSSRTSAALRAGAIPRPRFLSGASGTSRPRSEAASGKFDQEMKSALERIERDVDELKRRPATWSAGR